MHRYSQPLHAWQLGCGASRAAHLYVCGAGSVARGGVTAGPGGSGATSQRCASVYAPQQAVHKSYHTRSAGSSG